MTKKILYRQPDCFEGGQEKIAQDEEIPLKLIEYNAIEDKLSDYFCVVFNTKEDDDDDDDDFVKLISTFKTNKCGGCSDNCKKPFILFLVEMKQNIPFMTMENYNEICFSIEN